MKFIIGVGRPQTAHFLTPSWHFDKDLRPDISHLPLYTYSLEASTLADPSRRIEPIFNELWSLSVASVLAVAVLSNTHMATHSNAQGTCWEQESEAGLPIHLSSAQGTCWEQESEAGLPIHLSRCKHITTRYCTPATVHSMLHSNGALGH